MEFVTQTNEKGLKPWLFRSVAVFMGICYLLAPLQQEVTELMHLISHSLDQGKGHHSVTSHTHNINQQAQLDETHNRALFHSTKSHEHTGPNEIALHGHTHTHDTEPHTHEIIDFMSMVLSASNPTHHDKDNIKVPLELDKHLVVTTYDDFQTIPTFVKTYFSNLWENTSKGIQYLIVPPPKSLC
ncbi:MAG: hypothetical protein RH981_19025 [Arenibacter sp.]|jgi:hypothetical protein